jgi:hypothetical protein
MDPWSFFTALRDAEPHTTAAVDRFTLREDAASFQLSSGALTLVAVGEAVVGAVFEGEGLFTLEAPSPVERWQLQRVYDSPSADLRIEGAFFLLGPEVLSELRSALDFGPPEPGPDFGDLRDDGVKFLRHEDSGTVDSEAARALLNAEDPAFFHAHLEVDGEAPHYFRHTALAGEEVVLGREADGRGDYYEVVSTFHRAADYPVPDPRAGPRHPTEILQYEIESWISRGLDFRARARAFVSSSQSGGEWVPFYLSPELVLDSLKWGDGAAVDFRREDESAQFWVRLPSNPAFLEMTAWYRGRTVRYRDLWYWMDEPTGWYPRTGRTDATFDMTFHTDPSHQFLGSGTRTEHAVGEDVVTSRWVVDQPESQVSFSLGQFKEHTLESPGIPPLRVHMNDEFHGRLSDAYIGLQERGVVEAVAADLASALSFFQDVYGPLDVDEFNAAEIPGGHGQAFPGLIHLSYATFITTGADDKKGQNESFRAHEVAHQWWGFSVEPRSHRDRWLSEGLAEFSGLWYMQVARFNPETYLEALEESRERILDRRGRAGPISLGSRVTVGGRDEDYATVVYDKGAWVVHMLRNLLMDMDTMDETAFRDVMREVAGRFKNQRISTPEFRALVEAKLGGLDLGWFFDQWVHGSDIPTYRWAWRGEEVADGYKLTLRVRQEEVPEGFKMVVPVTVDFGVDGAATVKVMVAGPETVVDLPLLPREPDEVIFNDFESVLAEVRREGW